MAAIFRWPRADETVPDGAIQGWEHEVTGEQVYIAEHPTSTHGYCLMHARPDGDGAVCMGEFRTRRSARRSAARRLRGHPGGFNGEVVDS